jgi:hypothetical protein
MVVTPVTESSSPATGGIYWRVTQPAVRRAMSLQDFNPASATYGCCDRPFWQYRTISSFPAATMQQLALPFAVLFQAGFAGNEWYRSGEMLERARAAMLFWARSQHRSGAVDEWYRNEHSYCATAFTTFGIAESCLRLGEHVTASDRQTLLAALTASASWLADRFNEEVMNQNLAAAAALWNVHLLTGDLRFKAAFEKTWQHTLEHQDREGWFIEYGGADPGYGLLALDLLACLHQRGAAGAERAAEALSGFLAALTVSKSDLAGRLGSRGTEHSFAFGAEAFATTNADAARIALHLRCAILSDAVPSPATVDDRYLAYFYLPSFVMTASLGDRPIAAMTDIRSRAFAHSGFHVVLGRSGAVVCSTRRNGAFNLYAASGPVHRNLGYWIETRDARRFASCAWSSNAVQAQPETDRLTVEGRFVQVDDNLPLLRHEVAFRAATQWVLRAPAVAERFHRFVKRRKITRKVAAPLSFARELRWTDDRLIVTDTLRTRDGGAPCRLVIPAADIEVHSPSARLSGSSATDAIRVPRTTAEAWAERINQAGALVLVTTYEANADGQLTFVGIGEEPGARA